MEERTYKRPESVLVVVFTREGEVLLLRRREPPGFWQSVTGSLGWNETPAQAARRELEEETGLEPGGGLRDCERVNRFPIHPAWNARYAPGVTENVEHVFALPLIGRFRVRLDPREHAEYQWLHGPGALELASSHTDRVAIARTIGPGVGR
ncbi:MAG: dihydroneopterin triphosphate diphosphatase [Gammaproteobacteria bacterium]|nr:dihydroneopterin triphosphate diphosphatase [Gammaproteobacteria bacterium]